MELIHYELESDEKQRPLSASDVHIGKPAGERSVPATSTKYDTNAGAQQHHDMEDDEEANMMSGKTMVFLFGVTMFMVVITAFIAIGAYISITLFSGTACLETKGYQGPVGDIGLTGPTGPVGLSGPIGPRGLDGPKSSQIVGSSMYIRWGEKVCPDSAELVYEGLAAGGETYKTGGPVDTTCLPYTPDNEVVSGNSPGIIHTLKYYVDTFHHRSASNGYAVPCAMCHVADRPVAFMLPAVFTCPAGWTYEYSGYLMSTFRSAPASHKSYARRTGDTICVDNSTSTAGVNNKGGSDLVFVEARCDATVGTALGNCEHYVDGYELTCVVCSK